MSKIRTQMLEKARKALRAKRQRLVESAHLDNDGLDPLQNADAINDVSAIADHVRRQLDQVDVALRLVEDGTYGVCQECGKPIPAGRLDIMPDCTMCVPCQSSTK
jgi:DnaK suppressor protein